MNHALPQFAMDEQYGHPAFNDFASEGLLAVPMTIATAAATE